MRVLGKTLAALVACLVAITVHAQDDADPYAMVREACQNRLGLSEEEVAGGKDNPEPLKCYILCYLQEMAVLDESGNFNPELALNALRSEIREASAPGIYKCHEENFEFTDMCEHAYDIVACFSEVSPEIYQTLGIFTKPVIT